MLAQGLKLLISIVILLSARVAAAQTSDPSGRASAVDVGVNYVHENLNWPSSGRIGLSGVSVDLVLGSTSRSGFIAEMGIVSKGGAPGSQHQVEAWDYLVGPRIYVFQHERLAGFVESTFGGARITGHISSPERDLRVWINYAAWNVGVGVETRVGRRIWVTTRAGLTKGELLSASLAPQERTAAVVKVGLSYSFGLQ